jgi:murein DD-endopeptidase MepM/ murein hydrolase activator NlpD
MAFDFKMPVGTPILAADEGRIFVVVKQFKDNVDKGFDEANFIGFEHDGGMLTFYMHLMFEGSMVQVDDHVSRGQLIAYSGNTGMSSYPHLHFFAKQVVDICYNAEAKTADLALCPQVPVSFSNASPDDVVLKEWETYTALPY